MESVGVRGAVLGKIQGHSAKQPVSGVKLAAHEALHVITRGENDEDLNLPQQKLTLGELEVDGVVFSVYATEVTQRQKRALVFLG